MSQLRAALGVLYGFQLPPTCPKSGIRAWDSGFGGLVRPPPTQKGVPFFLQARISEFGHVGGNWNPYGGPPRRGDVRALTLRRDIGDERKNMFARIPRFRSFQLPSGSEKSGGFDGVQIHGAADGAENPLAKTEPEETRRGPLDSRARSEYSSVFRFRLGGSELRIRGRPNGGKFPRPPAPVLCF